LSFLIAVLERRRDRGGDVGSQREELPSVAEKRQKVSHPQSKM